MTAARETYTPALGHAALTPVYDAAIALMTRESVWRRAFLEQIAPAAGDVILDVGCGTGTLALLIKQAAPDATVIGLDPDAAILDRARDKSRRAAVEVDFEQGFASDAARLADRKPNKIVSSLVFHQVPLEEKRAGLAAIHAALQTGGALHVADYGLQRTRLMRALFRQIQILDGVQNTTPNAEGIMVRIMAEAGFTKVMETSVIPTPTGSISFYRAMRKAGGAQ